MPSPDLKREMMEVLEPFARAAGYLPDAGEDHQSAVNVVDDGNVSVDLTFAAFRDAATLLTRLKSEPDRGEELAKAQAAITALASGCEKLSGSPYWIARPFIDIWRKHGDVIEAACAAFRSTNKESEAAKPSVEELDQQQFGRVLHSRPSAQSGDGGAQPRPTKPSFEFTMYEGGDWLPNWEVHSLRFSDGREWDAVNGWRNTVAPPARTPREIAEEAVREWVSACMQLDDTATFHGLFLLQNIITDALTAERTRHGDKAEAEAASLPPLWADGR